MPKGEYADGEVPLDAAKREFTEEIGSPPPDGEYTSLGQAKVSSSKVVHAFALASDFNLERFHSNMFTMEWPPKSGMQQEFPEVDRAGWFAIPDALEKILSGQRDLVVELAKIRGCEPRAGPGWFRRD